MSAKIRLASILLAAAAIATATCSRASATVLFSDNFNVDSSGSWTTNVAPAANAAQQSATFAFDYSAFGIPAAPGSADTLGLRLRANVPGTAAAPVTTRPAGTISGLSVSPTGQNFGSTYQLSFYAWSNFNGAPNASGLADNANSQGGTNNVLVAVGTSGTVPVVVGDGGSSPGTSPLASGATMDGIGFATTGDGGISNDYRVYPKSGTFLPGTTAGIYAAGTSATSNQNTNAYYTTLFPANLAPAIQQTISTAEYGLDPSNTQAGSTQPGSFGFAWHRVVVQKNGNTVKWFIDNALIATVDASSLGALGGNNIALGQSDVNTTTTRHPSLLFTVFDNLEVNSSIPEANAWMFGALATVGGLGVWWRRRKGA